MDSVGLVYVEHMFELGRAELISEIDTMPPGPELAAVLAGVDREALSGYDRVALVRARSRLISHLQAELYADIESVSAPPIRRPGNSGPVSNDSSSRSTLLPPETGLSGGRNGG